MGRPLNDDDRLALCELEGGPHDGEFRWFTRDRILRDVELSDGSIYQLSKRLDGRFLLQHIVLRQVLAERARKGRSN